VTNVRWNKRVTPCYSVSKKHKQHKSFVLIHASYAHCRAFFFKYFALPFWLPAGLRENVRKISITKSFRCSELNRQQSIRFLEQYGSEPPFTLFNTVKYGNTSISIANFHEKALLPYSSLCCNGVMPTINLQVLLLLCDSWLYVWDSAGVVSRGWLGVGLNRAYAQRFQPVRPNFKTQASSANYSYIVSFVLQRTWFSFAKAKTAKGSDSYIARLTRTKPDQPRFTIIGGGSWSTIAALHRTR